MKTDFDVIVVGAGSAGCALAYRLAKESALHVALLEAGSPARNPMMHMPLGFAFLLKPHKNNWAYKTGPEQYLNDRQVDLPRGKVLGGCSAINGMVYIRGQREDFNRWAELGNPGWSFDEVLPYFRVSEDCENGMNHYHGIGGPLWVGNVVDEFPINKAFIKACEQAGHPFNPDVNGETQAGVSWFPHNIKNGRRWSSASAFLGAGKALPNLTVITHAHVKRVVIEKSRATAVDCDIQGKPVTLTANKEIVLCGGAINSPKILELSGVGDKAVLRDAGIPVVHDLPGVGENLHDHWNSYIKQNVAGAKTYFSESKPLAMLRNLLRYLVSRKGFLGNPAALVAVFYKSLESAETPDTQIHFAPAASEFDAKGNMQPINAVTIATCGVRPTSRGSVHVQTPDYNEPPAIQVNFLATRHDRELAVEALKKARAIIAQDALKPFVADEFEPGPHVQSDEEILEYIKNTGDPVHHLAGSCKMGNDAMAVVDATLRVHGIDGLRVADASIMPEVVSGNTHAACVMIGEKCAAMILEDK